MTVELLPDELLAFQRFIYRFYHAYGRHHLPWRQNVSPYQILVSETMLQQTQVERVIPKFLAFIDRFPTPEVLAQSSVSEVIRLWQGLGYNRRGLNLQRAAQVLVTQFQGNIPSETEKLLSLPGVGPYTASAIQVFAFNLPQIVIETNIRTVMLYHFFHGAYNVSDQELSLLVEQAMDRENSRHWYSALMDYGTYLKQVIPNPSRQSKHYVKQSRFVGSLRQVRGQILKTIARQPRTETELGIQLPFEPTKIDAALSQLISEGFLQRKQGKIQLAE